ncbi:MAG: hypothetical protein H7X80_08980 [bacterium]|nr:hypothetical protein [Candidatus Kapabacteria bacterium]
MLVACAAEKVDTTPADSVVVSSESPRLTDSAKARARAVVRPSGWGPIHFGMTIDDLHRVRPDLDDSTVSAIPGGQCYHLRVPPDTSSAGIPTDLLLMINEGRVARIEVRDSITETVEGARVGDSEARIRSLYAGRLRVEPHEYVDGHYLIVMQGDNKHRIVFETDGKRVTRYRAGRHPEVEWVEGCS